MKTYVLTLSATFPLRHPRAGEPTEFKDKLDYNIKSMSEAMENVSNYRESVERLQKKISQLNAQEER